ncbi:hypothetical protein D3Z53_17755 [Lachnospiraceae bacterium]|jgi:hypothetical protein|nr:hypothetical protein [uncultured Schaedlerella sp.]MCI9154772.1 hypothetical protein [Ruminococcus sp.]NBI59852.1 hypothetical protein [Lachnospiraceae bacterium]
MKRIEAADRKKWRAWCLLFLLGAVTLFCFGKAVCYAEILKMQASKLNFAAHGRQGALDYAGARSAQEENQKQDHPLEYVNWTQTDGVQVSASSLGTMVESNALLLCGRSDLLFPGYAVLDTGTEYGCLLSSALSGRLFGGEDTRGLIVEVQDRKLEVLDVIDSEEIFLAYEAGEEDPCSFDRAAVSCVSGEISKTEERYQQICGGWERLEGRVLVWIAEGACFLLPCILWIFLMCYCVEMSRAAGRMERAGRIEKIIWKALLYLLLAGGILLLIRNARIPEDMIPAKWSDFDFWTEYGKELGASCQALIRSEKKIPDIPMMKAFVKALQWAAAAVVGEIVFLRRFRKI